MGGTAAPLYPPVFMSMSTSMTFRGSMPRPVRKERSSPRTATKEEVTRTAQSAICTASSNSRALNLRPGVAVQPDLITPGIGLKDLAHRNSTKNQTGTMIISNAKAYTRGSRLTAAWTGYLGSGRHALSHCRSKLLEHSPTAPPMMETRIASVKSWRRIRTRVEPSARRTAISRERFGGASREETAKIGAGGKQDKSAE